MELASRLGKAVHRIDAAVNGQVKAISEGCPLLDRETYLLVNIGMNNTQISVVKQGKIQMNRAIGVGASALDDLLGSRYGMTRVDAEQLRIKESYASHGISDEDCETIARIGYSAIEDSMRQTIDYYGHSQSDAVITKIVLSGGGSRFCRLSQHLTEMFGIPAEIVKPAFRSFPAKEDPFPYLAIIGAMIEPKELQKDINLVPKLHLLAVSNARSHRIGWLVGLLGGLLLVSAAGYGYLYWNTDIMEQDRTLYLEQMSQYQGVNEVQRDVLLVEAQVKGIQDAISIAEGVMPEAVDLLDRLTAKMPAGVFVRSISLDSANRINLSGMAEDRNNVAELLAGLKDDEGMANVSISNVSTQMSADGTPLNYMFSIQVDVMK